MINQFVLSGRIKRIQITDKNPAKVSAVVLVQYGSSRERTGGPVEFINALMVRIPPFRYEKVKEFLKEDVRVDVTGHMQGVLKQVMAEGYMTSELVVDRVTFPDMEEDAIEAE